MPDVFVPPEVAASFVAYMTAQGGALPPSFTELSSRLSAALATPTPSGVLSLSQPTQRAFSASTSRASRATDTLPRRALAPRRMHSLPPEDADGPEEFLAALQRHTLPALPVLRGATLQSPPSLPPTPPVISTSLPHDLAPSPSSSLASSPNRHGSVFGSSPTLQGNNTPPSRCRFLSPLRLDSETLAGSPSESTLRKRKAYLITEERDGELNDGEERDDEEEDEAEWRRLEEAAQRARESWTGLKIRIPARGAAAGGGEGGGHGGGAGGGNSINLWTPDCPRRGDAERMGSAAAIGHMPCDQSGCGDCEGGGGEDEENNDDRAGQGSGRGLQGRGRNNAQGGKRKRAKKIKATWRLDEDGGPPITEGAGLLLSKLLAVFGRAHRQDLEEVLEGMIDGSLSTTSHDMASVVASIKRQTNEIRVRELHLMLSLIQLALNVDSLRADNKLKCLPRRRVTDKALAEQYAPGTHENTFRDWVHHGKKLALLCAGGTLYLLPIIAALNLRTYITRQVPGEDILSLASALRRVKHGLWRPMVHQLMIPIFHMRGCSSGYVEGLRLHWNMPQPVGNHSPDVQTFAFRDIEVSDRIFDNIETNFPILHKRSPEWDSATVPAWKVLPDPSKTPLAPIFTLKTPLKYEKTPSPVTKANRNEFTNTQRRKAEGATVAKNLDDLQARVNYLHAGGKAKLGEYVKISSDILEGRALHMVDNNGKLLSLLFMVPAEYRQRLFDAIMHIHTCMPGEFKDADSREKFFKYLACHYSWYARYAEKGKGAPQAHPDNVRRDHAGRVNFEQRNVHRSKDMKDPNEYSVLVEAYTDFFEILRIALKEYLPEDYDELSIFVEHLPLDASSPCYPFGGFVINLRACTWAHRDAGDKKLCLVVPFGSFTGGELCLYETGFCFDLKLGDVLIFPSCDLTHFNLHFQGTRGTLVLHSDRQGDDWVRDCNGWSASYVRHS